VSTALSLWGSDEQQATYLPAFTGDDVPAAALALTEPRPLYDALAPETTAVRDGDGFVLDGVKSLVPRAADAELFVVGALLDGAPALFLVESSTEGLRIESEPSMGVRAAGPAACCSTTRVGPIALLRGHPGEAYADVSGSHASAGAPSRSAPLRRSSTTSSPTSMSARRSGSRSATASRSRSWSPTSASSCRPCAWSPTRPPAAPPRASRSTASRARPEAVRERGMQIGNDGVQLLGGPRLRQGAPRRTVVPRPAAIGVMEEASRLSLCDGHPIMINLETPKKFRPLVGQAHQVAMNLLRPNSRKYDQFEHEYPKELDMLAAMIDGLSESGAASGAGASGVRREEGTPDDAAAGTKNGSNLARYPS
jgi:hypothetical protein